MYHKRCRTGFERLAKSRFNVLTHSASGLIVAIPLIEDRRSQKEIVGCFPARDVPLTARTLLIYFQRAFRIRCPSTGRFQLLSSLGGVQAAPAILFLRPWVTAQDRNR